jgi:hypothetical protein
MLTQRYSVSRFWTGRSRSLVRRRARIRRRSSGASRRLVTSRLPIGCGEPCMSRRRPSSTTTTCIPTCRSPLRPEPSQPGARQQQTAQRRSDATGTLRPGRAARAHRQGGHPRDQPQPRQRHPQARLPSPELAGQPVRGADPRVLLDLLAPSPSAIRVRCPARASTSPAVSSRRAAAHPGRAPAAASPSSSGGRRSAGAPADWPRDRPTVAGAGSRRRSGRAARRDRGRSSPPPRPRRSRRS